MSRISFRISSIPLSDLKYEDSRLLLDWRASSCLESRRTLCLTQWNWDEPSTHNTNALYPIPIRSPIPNQTKPQEKTNILLYMYGVYLVVPLRKPNDGVSCRGLVAAGTGNTLTWPCRSRRSPGFRFVVLIIGPWPRAQSLSLTSSPMRAGDSDYTSRVAGFAWISA